MPKPKATEIITPFNYCGVQLREGRFKDQFDQTTQYYLDISNDDMLRGFRRRVQTNPLGKDLGGWFTADASRSLAILQSKEKPTSIFNTFGQWLGSFARMHAVTGDSAISSKLEYLLTEWGKAIESDGFFFYGANPNARHYEFEKIVGGLVDVYEYANRKESIEYLQKIIGWAVGNLERRRIPATPDYFTGGSYWGGEDADTEWYTLPENLYRAYLLTGDSTYRDFARVWHYETYWSDLVKERHSLTGLHAYSHVNTLSSAAMAYAVTGDTSYLETIVNAYEILQKTQVFATGGYGPGERMANQYGSLGSSLYLQENTFENPCGSWAAFKLARYLMMFTGKATYGDWIEKLLYNGIGASLPMGEGGKTPYYSDYRVGGGEKKYHRDTWTCCSGTYPLVVNDYHNIIYFKDGDGIYVNLFVASQVEWNIEGKQIRLIQHTDFPETGNISLTIGTSTPVEFCLRFRIPSWARRSISVKVNDHAYMGEWIPGTWGKVSRMWDDGDNIQIRFDLDLHFVPVDRYHPNVAALMCGPVVLAAEKPVVLRGDTEDPSSWILPMSNQSLTFRPRGSGSTEFRPYYAYGEGQRYYMYQRMESAKEIRKEGTRK